MLLTVSFYNALLCYIVTTTKVANIRKLSIIAGHNFRYFYQKGSFMFTICDIVNLEILIEIIICNLGINSYICVNILFIWYDMRCHLTNIAGVNFSSQYA